MKETLSKLTERCIEYFKQHSFSRPRIDRYKFVWSKKLAPYMAEHSIRYYNPSVEEAYIQANIVWQSVTPYQRDLIRCIHVLSELQETGRISQGRTRAPKRELLGPIGLLMERFLLHLESLRRSVITINDHRLYLHGLLTYLKSKRINKVEEIKELHIITFLSTDTNNKIGIISSVRMFFSFLYEERLIKRDLSLCLRRFKWVRKEKMPSVYSKKEVLNIERSIIRSDATGKRNYAILLLATRLGLRASDIAHLCFSNLNWEQSIIVLSHFKTGNKLKVPLLAVVGNAIIDYLKYARKHSDSNRIFLYTTNRLKY
jgi:site-specific recombinase XerC